MSTSLFFQHVRVFDGTELISDTNVFVEHGKIAAVGPALQVPSEAQVIDGTGRTLLPGLIDAHTHTFGQMLVEALMFGVTTELDMFTDYHMVAEIKRAQANDGNPTMADLFSSGTLATAPHGHGTEYGLTIPTLTSPEEAQAFVDARIAAGSE